MIEVVVLNEKGKIELSKEELEAMLERARQEGYNANHSWITTIPPITNTPWRDVATPTTAYSEKEIPV